MGAVSALLLPGDGSTKEIAFYVLPIPGLAAGDEV